MTIARKMILLLLMSGGVMFFCVFLLADHFMLRNVRRTEAMEVRHQLERARRAFDAESAALFGVVQDWAAWDDTCKFLSDTNLAYVTSNLTDEFFQKNRMHLVLAVNAEGAVIYGRHLQRNDSLSDTRLQGLLSGLEGFGWLSGMKEGAHGVAMLPGGMAFCAAAPVLDSHYSGSSRGLLVMARYVDAEEQDYLSQLYGVTLHVCPGKGVGRVITRCALCRPELDIPLYFNPLNSAPPLKVMIRVPHVILHDHAQSDRFVMLASLLVLYVLICGLAALVVKQDILRRLNHLAGFVRSIKPDAFPSDRVQVGGDDELTLLARAVNRMLDDMARAQVLENRVRQVEKRQALGTLAAGISHDFNNMLYVIIGYVTMMKARISGDSVSNEYLDRIVKAVERASGLVRQLLSFGRRDEQGASRFSLAMIIRESVALFQASLPGSVEIRLKLAEAPDTILADSAQIYQMLMNLYINALQAIGQKGGLITITTTVHRADEIKALIPQGNDALKWLCLSVSDTGCGIPAEDLGRVFDPYFSTKPVGEGSGLGLSVVHQIAESAGGSVHVTSSVGAGSVFSAFLPLDQADSNPGDYHPSSDQVE